MQLLKRESVIINLKYQGAKPPESLLQCPVFEDEQEWMEQRLMGKDDREESAS